MTGNKAIMLIDGHHYLHVLTAAMRHAENNLGYSVAGALFLGKPGKLGSIDSLSQLEIPILTAATDFKIALREACAKFKPDVILDMSGPPLLDMRDRLALANEALSSGVSYTGPDFSFSAPPSPDLPKAPSLAILGAGKRVGKTAVCSYAARKIAASGFKPVILTMGRGGPAEPLLIRGDNLEITPEFLVEEAGKGRHAASDNYEEALFTKLPTIGCFRAGGGLAGSPFLSTVREGAELANSLECDFHIYEGSGNTAPPVRTDASIVAASASLPLEQLEKPFMSAFLRNADMVVITGCEEPVSNPEKVRDLVSAIRATNENARIKTVVLRPEPSEPLEGRKVVFATSAPAEIAAKLASHLESEYGCKVTGVTSHLSDRGMLKNELPSLLSPSNDKDKPDMLLTELKAASMQVAVPMALNAGLKAAFCQNVPVGVEPEKSGLAEAIMETAQKAFDKYRAEHSQKTEKR